MLNARGFISISIAFLALSACASYDKRHVDYGTPQDYANTSTIDGVTLAAEPFDTEAKVKETFDENLLAKDYYPIRVMLENNSNGRILVLRETVELIDLNGQVYRPVEAAVVAEDFEDSEMAYALLGFGVFSYASAKDANLERQADYSAKQMPPSQLIPSGRKRGAFLYFRLPKDVDLSSCRLRLEVEHMDDQKVTQFDLQTNAY